MTALGLWLSLLLGLAPPSCDAAFERALAAMSRLDMPARAPAALAALGTCAPLGPLAQAARDAARQPREARARTLIAASGVDAACAQQRCQPLPASLEMAPRALADVDAGSYALALAAQRALVAAGLWSPRSERVLMTLLLASALEGERLRERSPR